MEGNKELIQRKLNRKLRTKERDKKLKECRKFLGKLSNFNSKEEKDYEQRHLKAYLKGKSSFKARLLKDLPNPQNSNSPDSPKLPDIPKGTFWIFPVLQEFYNL